MADQERKFDVTLGKGVFVVENLYDKAYWFRLLLNGEKSRPFKLPPGGKKKASVGFADSGEIKDEIDVTLTLQISEHPGKGFTDNAIWSISFSGSPAPYGPQISSKPREGARKESPLKGKKFIYWLSNLTGRRVTAHLLDTLTVDETKKRIHWVVNAPPGTSSLSVPKPEDGLFESWELQNVLVEIKKELVYRFSHFAKVESVTPPPTAPPKPKPSWWEKHKKEVLLGSAGVIALAYLLEK